MKNHHLAAALCVALAAALYFAMPSKEYSAGFALLGMFFAMATWSTSARPNSMSATPSRLQSDSDLTFCLKIELDIEEHEFFDMMHRVLAGSERTGGYIKYSGNAMTLALNTFRDTDKAKSGPNAWQYYTYDLDVFPVEEVDLENQRNLARELISLAEKLNGTVDIVAEFAM